MGKARRRTWKWARRLFLLLLGFGCGSAQAVPMAEPAPVLVGYIKKLMPDPAGGDREVAQERAQVGMKGTGNTVDSDARGMFRLQLLQIVRPGQQIEIEVGSVPGWVLYQPADGRLVVPQAPQTVTLRLLPKGSLRLLEHEGIASLIRRLMSESKDRVPTPSALPPGSPPPPLDLTGPMQNWANKYGLTLPQVQSAVNQWATQVLSQKQKDDEDICLAHFSQSRFAEAATCFDVLGQDDVEELKRLQTQTLERTERAARRFMKAALAHEAQYDYAAAMREYEAAAKWVKREVSAELWAEHQTGLGSIHREFANQVVGEAVQQHLSLAVAAFRRALTVRTKQASPEDWAATQNILGCTLEQQSTYSQGEATLVLLAQAVSAFCEALTVRTRQAWPRDWAMTQNNLGNALIAQASRTPGPAGTALLKLAVSAYREALTVRTKQAWPQGWATTQKNLAAALTEQARRTQGQEGTALLESAVSAYREVLTVRTKRAVPNRWAMTQYKLGEALQEQARRTQEQAGTVLLELAVASYHEALTVFTKQAWPQPWATTQYTLGRALTEQARRTQEQAKTWLLDQAVLASREALRVLTKSALPQFWAEAHISLGDALLEQAWLTPGQAGTALSEQAISALREALTVFDQQSAPQQWAAIQYLLGNALYRQARRLPAEHAGRTALLTQAIDHYRAALTVRSQATFPLYWEQTQVNLAEACALLPNDSCAAVGASSGGHDGAKPSRASGAGAQGAAAACQRAAW